MGKLRYRSASKLDCKRSCPAMYDCKYRQKLPDQVGPPALIGRAFHKFAEVYVQHLVDTHRQSDWEEVSRIFESLRTDPAFAELPPEQVPATREMCVQWAQKTIIDPEAVAAVEMQIPDGFRRRMDAGEWGGFQANLGDDIVYVGIMDRVEVSGNTLTIIDYKTGWKAPSETELRKDPQVRYYPWAVSQEFPGDWERFVVRMEYVAQGIIREVEIDPVDLPDIERDLLAECNALDEGPFPATPGAACSYCSYTAQCPGYAAIPDVVKPPATAKEAETIVSSLVLLKRRVKEWEDLLKGWCNIHGAVNNHGIEWGFWAQGGPKVKDARALALLLKEEAWKCLSVDNTALKRLLKKHPDLADLVGPLMVEEKITKFTSKKAGEEDE